MTSGSEHGSLLATALWSSLKIQWLGLRHFIAGAYRDPVWIIAATIWVVLSGWLFHFLATAPDQMALGPVFQRAQKEQLDEKVIGEIRPAMHKAFDSELAALKFIDNNIHHMAKTPSDRLRCVELAEKAQTDLAVASTLTNEAQFRLPESMRFQAALRSEIACFGNDVSLTKSFCEARTVPNEKTLVHRMVLNELNCRTAVIVHNETFEADFHALHEELRYDLKREKEKSSFLALELRLAYLANLYSTAFLLCVAVGWHRRIQLIRSGSAHSTQKPSG